MIYLERVVICLRGLQYWEEAQGLAKRLRAGGLESRIEAFPEESAAADERGGAKSQNAAESLTAKWAGEKMPTLFVTDMSQFAGRLVGDGRPVLAFLHEGNWEEDFSACRYACERLGELDAEYLDRVYRRYMRLPWDILETERCLVRESTEEDVEAFYRIYREPAITKYMEDLYDDPQEEREYIRDYIDQVYSFYNFGIWTVVERGAGEVIGRAGLCYREGYEDPEIGFVIALPWQGKGYATEVCEAVMRYAGEVLGFSRVLAFVRPENEVSMHICRKLGVDIFEINS